MGRPTGGRTHPPSARTGRTAVPAPGARWAHPVGRRHGPPGARPTKPIVGPMTHDWLRIFFEIMVIVVVCYFAVANGFWTALLVAAAWGMVPHHRANSGEDLRRQLGSSVLPKVSLLVPAYNE